MSDNRNMVIALILSVAIMLGWQFLYALPQAEQQRLAYEAQQQQQAAQTQTPGTPGSPATSATPQAGGGVAARPARLSLAR
ncbi:hypothetical protein [Methylobrevis pamukkalensis]|uniref:Membrane protein insertase n=1 Tax=Methylobrevis pamukkalensis TaxID=1439726 RepID=A0A1E3GYM6_9HYPH|nr:hypothetical protein [Methylobrevis pamukkalensis]ODN69168.1 membrane protein insertase [Methylobrevis pamukkalensis]